MIKRIFLALLLLGFVFFIITIAEGTYSYIQVGDYGYPIQQLFSAIGYSEAKYTESAEAIFDESASEYLRTYQRNEGLEASGSFDFDTISHILHGSNYLPGEEIVWIPMHGGKKYHKNPECSSMYEPNQVPVACADSLGFSFCKRCYK